jgi:hypothetical protein
VSRLPQLSAYYLLDIIEQAQIERGHCSLTALLPRSACWRERQTLGSRGPKIRRPRPDARLRLWRKLIGEGGLEMRLLISSPEDESRATEALNSVIGILTDTGWTVRVANTTEHIGSLSVLKVRVLWDVRLPSGMSDQAAKGWLEHQLRKVGFGDLTVELEHQPD